MHCTCLWFFFGKWLKSKVIKFGSLLAYPMASMRSRASRLTGFVRKRLRLWGPFQDR